MEYLVDTNVWLERLLNQARSDGVEQFLRRIPTERLHITDFALHSLSVILTRLKRPEALLRFIQDLFRNGAVSVVRLGTEDTEAILQVMDKFHLDFDDAYQYLAAEIFELTLVSLDADFKRTEKGYMAPEEVES